MADQVEGKETMGDKDHNEKATKRLFHCNFCPLTFYSPRSLGGHQSAHRNRKDRAKKKLKTKQNAELAVVAAPPSQNHPFMYSPQPYTGLKYINQPLYRPSHIDNVTKAPFMYNPQPYTGLKYINQPLYRPSHIDNVTKPCHPCSSPYLPFEEAHTPEHNFSKIYSSMTWNNGFISTYAERVGLRLDNASNYRSSDDARTPMVAERETSSSLNVYQDFNWIKTEESKKESKLDLTLHL